MNSMMNTKKKMPLKNKKGVYILEGSMILPPLVIIMIMLISVISVISAAEDALFILGEELKVAGIEAAFVKDGISTTYTSLNRIGENNHGKARAMISDYGYLYRDSGMEDLISVGISLDYSGVNPLGNISGFKVSQRVRTRAFTGLDRRDDPDGGLGDYDESKTVYIFPDRGEKYHNRGCYFLNPASQMVFLTSDIKKKFDPCSVCHSSSAGIGDVVYCFFTDGKVYHLENCPTVDKYYIEMEKKDAEARGYTPCLTCGG